MHLKNYCARQGFVVCEHMKFPTLQQISEILVSFIIIINIQINNKLKSIPALAHKMFKK